MESISGINGNMRGVDFRLDTQTSSDQRRQGAGSFRVSEQDSKNTDATGLRLSPEQEKVVRELQQRDQEVRAHERAHQAAAGGAAGQASYTYQRGPDGRQYAIGGEVSVEISGGTDPQAALKQAQLAQAAAMAPATPSAPDVAAAAQSAQVATQARRMLDEQAAGISGASSLSSASSSDTNDTPRSFGQDVPGAAAVSSKAGPAEAAQASSAASAEAVSGAHNFVGDVDETLPPSQTNPAAMSPSARWRVFNFLLQDPQADPANSAATQRLAAKAYRQPQADPPALLGSTGVSVAV